MALLQKKGEMDETMEERLYQFASLDQYTFQQRLTIRLAGLALYFFNFSTFVGRAGLYLEDLYVRTAFRRQGVGLALLAELARVALAHGCGRMEWAVLDWNQPAIDFYERLGARPLDDWRVFRLTPAGIAALSARSPRTPS